MPGGRSLSRHSPLATPSFVGPGPFAHAGVIDS